MTNPEIDAWLRQLPEPTASGSGPEPVLPSPGEAREQLRWLGVPEVDVEPVVASMPDSEQVPELWEALRRCHAELCSDLGVIRPSVTWPDAPASLGAAGRYFYVHLFLAALPVTLAWHQRLGVSSDVSRDTLGDLGVKASLYRRAHGVGGMDEQAWMVRHFRGTLFRLGRLQFDRDLLTSEVFDGDPRQGSSMPGGPVAGDLILDVHIPGDGPMTPELCDESFARAKEFFPRHFPDERPVHAMCRSWLLDDQLAEYLAPEANILRFQRRFQLFPQIVESDSDVLAFVFVRCLDADDIRPDSAVVAALPQDSTLQRAIVAHLRAGRHWFMRSGWMPLGAPVTFSVIS